MDPSRQDLAEDEELVISWLNQASLESDVAVKTDYLSKVQEIILNKQPKLLDTYLHEVLAFQNDRNIDVRKCVVNFLEAAIKNDCELLPKIVINIQVLLQDKAPQVQKRVVQTATHMYRLFLSWMTKSSTVNDQMQAVWNVLCNMKAFIINMVDCENDGLRTQIVKFLETVVLLQTHTSPDIKKKANEFSLEDIPYTLKLAKRRKLEEEALTVFDLMLKFHGSAHISSANLITCMGSLVTIAKVRPQFYGKVVHALELLHLNVPPTLSTSQVSSVRKQLKMQLLVLLKQPNSYEHTSNIASLLTDLGASSSEIMKAYPKIDDRYSERKRSKRSVPEVETTIITVKKQKIDVIEPSPSESAIDITENFIVPRLSPEVAANLVLTFMLRLPDVMPPIFSSAYTPIAAAGTQGQIKHVARLLATQLTEAGLGPGASVTTASNTQLSQPKVVSNYDDDDEEMEDENKSAPDRTPLPVEEGIQTPLVTSSSAPSHRTFKPWLHAKPLTHEMRDNLEIAAVKRILAAEPHALKGGVANLRTKLLATLAASFSYKTRQTVLEYILSDLRGRIGLALSWLYEEYSLLQGFNKRPPNQLQDGVNCSLYYQSLLTTLIQTAINNKDIKDRETILRRLFVEVPILTEEACDVLKQLCANEPIGLTIVSQLISLRPPKQLSFLNLLLVSTSHQDSEIRESAMKQIVNLYKEREELRFIVEEFGLLYAGFLALAQPPDILYGIDKGRLATSNPTWSEDVIRACLYLYIALLPLKHNLIQELARVYVLTAADVKRIVLRLLEPPIKAMGMESPELLSLVEECPKGSETLITRIIQILTDKNAPSEDLVAKVRDLYQTRVSDVRFLIPVLIGLSKQEIIAALPKLIKLNPAVVKEVFNKLLGTHGGVKVPSPITPAELLIALHVIDSTKVDLKTIMKATSLCLTDKEAYSQEVLAVVLQQLMEVTPLPTLLMRTVIQALTFYPRLIGFVMNILQRLIIKQVWNQPKVWEGFIKCCQRTQPHSFQVLLQLPPAQLQQVFSDCPDLKKPLLEHIMAFTDNQRAHIPQNILDILIGAKQPIVMDFKIKEEPMSPPDLTIDVKEDFDEVPKMFIEPAPPGMDYIEHH